jgi:hypothetical protein
LKTTDSHPPLVDDSNKYTTDRGTLHSPWITALDDNYYNPDAVAVLATKFISLTEIRFTNSNKQNVYNEKVTYYRQVHCNYIYELYLTEEEEKKKKFFKDKNPGDDRPSLSSSSEKFTYKITTALFLSFRCSLFNIYSRIPPTTSSGPAHTCVVCMCIYIHPKVKVKQ